MASSPKPRADYYGLAILPQFRLTHTEVEYLRIFIGIEEEEEEVEEEVRLQVQVQPQPQPQPQPQIVLDVQNPNNPPAIVEPPDDANGRT
jgi:hypothetical protein